MSLSAEVCFWIAFLPLLFQGAFLLVDEFVCHYRRGLPQWERWGHPLDTATVLIVFAYCLIAPFSAGALILFLLLSLFSCFFVTKDEWVHARECTPMEHWLHAVLFVCHPMVFVSTAFFWVTKDVPAQFGLEPYHAKLARQVLLGQTSILVVFILYQIIFWNFVPKQAFGSNAQSSLPMKQSESAGPQSFV